MIFKPASSAVQGRADVSTYGTATYTRLQDGRWAIRVCGQVSPGDPVDVAKRDGSVCPTVAGRVIERGEGWTLVEPDRVAGRRRRQSEA